MDRNVASLIAALTACSSSEYQLAAVPIVGGTAEQQAAVRRAMVEVEAELAVPSPFVQEVRIEATSDFRVRANWSSDDAVMRIPTTMLGGSDLSWVVRHELCHAIDRQQDFVERHEPFPLLPGLAVHGSSDRKVKGELFARVCHHGPAGVALLADVLASCEPEAAWVAEQVGAEVFHASRQHEVWEGASASSRVGLPPQDDVVDLDLMWPSWRGPWLQVGTYVEEPSGEVNRGSNWLLNVTHGTWAPTTSGAPPGDGSSSSPEVIAQGPFEDQPVLYDDLLQGTTVAWSRTAGGVFIGTLRLVYFTHIFNDVPLVWDGGPVVRRDGCVPGGFMTDDYDGGRPVLLKSTLTGGEHAALVTVAPDGAAWVELTGLLNEVAPEWRGP